MKKLITIEGEKDKKGTTAHKLGVKSAEEGKNASQKIKELIEDYVKD
jgi:hypothetical protein